MKWNENNLFSSLWKKGVFDSVGAWNNFIFFILLYLSRVNNFIRGTAELKDEILFCILYLFVYYFAVNSLWSSNTKAMAFRDLPFEVQVIKQMVLPEVSYTHKCFERCEINFDCRKLQDCGYCRRQSSKSPFKRCLTPRWFILIDAFYEERGWITIFFFKLCICSIKTILLIT